MQEHRPGGFFFFFKPMPAVKTSAAKISSSSSDSESEGHDANDEINVDFGFKDINPDVDYQAIKTLLMQTIGHTDATELPTGTLESLAELIISDRDLVGTCIKAEEEEEEEDKGGYGDDDEDERLVGSAVSTGKAAAAAGPSSSLPTSQNDPLALFTVINITHHSSNKAVQSLKSHILSKIPVKSAFHAKLKELFERDPSTNKKHIGLIINERLINMPPQLFPPLLNLSMEEIEWAVEEVRECIENGYREV